MILDNKLSKQEIIVLDGATGSEMPQIIYLLTEHNDIDLERAGISGPRPA